VLAALWAAACSEPRFLRTSVGPLEALPPQLAFAATTLGVEARGSLKVAQRGLLPADVTRVELDPADAPFDLSTLPSHLGRGRTATLKVSFRPRTAGLHRARLTVFVAEGEPLVLSFEGRGVDARGEPLAGVEFGRAALGGVRHRRLALRNVSESAVPVKLSLEGAGAEEFVITPRLTLPPHAVVEAKVRWEPVGHPGTRDVVVRLVACPLCLPRDIAVRADAVAEALVVAPDPIEVASAALEPERWIVVQVTNATDELIAVRGAGLSPGSDPGLVLDAPALPAWLPALETLRLRVRFPPAPPGTAKASLELVSDASPVGTRSVPIRASGGAQPVDAPLRRESQPPAAGLPTLLPTTIADGELVAVPKDPVGVGDLHLLDAEAPVEPRGADRSRPGGSSNSASRPAADGRRVRLQAPVR
jgi:hypothetical protein